ncbi:MAG: class I tRNA ligase family protein [Chitinophagales bacterium]|nr:class I tRNA ligase family protein [Chitinophagales bacterium]
MEYNFKDIEARWQQYWRDGQVYKVSNDPSKPKCYVLDMFPYPSGAGLHVGHPLGYIATDIYSRYKRLKGFNVLHPMGFDAFGLPAEQYAIQTGNHPGAFTDENLLRYRQQLDAIGFNYDWDRSVETHRPDYYKWTQWIFIQLFHSWYDKKAEKARPVAELEALFALQGNQGLDAATDMVAVFTAQDWAAMDEKARQETLMHYRLAYQSYTDVNWCEELGTVLANDEVKDGVSERGGYPVIRRPMRQWSLRITAYADRLLKGLEIIDWPDSLKEQQRNWIGRSEGASIVFQVAPPEAGQADSAGQIEIFTTRPDTIFGATFMVLAPEHELVEHISSQGQQGEVAQYKEYVQNRSERERQAEVKKVTGAFTGAYAIHPFTQERIPIWISEYVLMGYGTGAIMAVPSDDERDQTFAKHFGLPIVPVVDKTGYPADAVKVGKLINSDFLNGLEVKEAISLMCRKVEEMGIGKAKVNYRLRDAGFSRQRYWGEPFPIYYKDDMPYTLPEDQLPVTLPEVESYKPTGTGESPLATATDWVNLSDGTKRETDTMPGYAGSSWYFLRYMDPHNNTEFAGKAALDYWQDVDLYVGGSEHAVGHLLYSRFWHKFLHDLGYVPSEEPFKKLVNQGMIQGVSEKILMSTGGKLNKTFHDYGGILIPRDNPNNLSYTYYYSDDFYTEEQKASGGLTAINVPIQFVTNNVLDIPKYLISDKGKGLKENAVFLAQNGYWQNGEFHHIDVSQNHLHHNYTTEEIKNLSSDFRTFSEVEKMSKSKDNVVNPDDIIAKYGADTFRLYEMFLGPIELSKPWITNGLDGVAKFMRKFWRLFYDENGLKVTDAEPSKAELKTLHKTIKKIEEDTERLAFNTCVSAFMICVNELTELGCHKKAILKDLVVLMAPFAPHVAEELWQHALGQPGTVNDAAFPQFKPEHLVESSFNYPVSINGKVRANIELPLDMDAATVQETVLSLEDVQKWTEGKAPKRFIHVPGRIVNVVV